MFSKETCFSSVSREKPFIYVYKTKDALKTFYPADDCLLKIGEKLCNSAEQQQQTPGENVEARRPWEKYLQDALNVLQKKTEFDFKRPDATTDKLYLDIDNEDVIEISHPIGSQMPKDSFRLHLGAIGGGSATSMLGNTNVRLDFAKKYGLLATDTGMNTILEAIIGNCRDSFILVKGNGKLLLSFFSFSHSLLMYTELTFCVGGSLQVLRTTMMVPQIVNGSIMPP